MESQDLLGNAPAPPVIAGKDLRFVNYFVDNICLACVEVFLYYFVTRYRPDFATRIEYSENPAGTIQLFTFLLQMFYYTLMELFNRGKTLGKMVTRTHAVRTDGQGITIKEAFLRSVVRAVPLEFVSIFFNYLLHDKWTNTVVVRDPYVPMA